MTFSSNVKNELYDCIPKFYNNALGEVVAILNVLDVFMTRGVHEIYFRIESENKNIVKYIERIFSEHINKENILYSNGCNYFSEDSKYVFEVCSNVRDFFLSALVELSTLNMENVGSLIDGKSFIKGIFLVCGSVSNPQKGYHLEFVFQDENLGVNFMGYLNQYGLNSKIIKRKKCYTVYIKESDNISKVFSIMGAHNAVLEFEDIRVKKEYSNNKNRIKNCIEANEDKMIIASVRHVQAIMLIDEVIGMNKLPKNLREIAEIRLKHKEMSLKDLGKFLIPPIGKSGVSHRLKKIEQIAGKLRR